MLVYAHRASTCNSAIVNFVAAPPHCHHVRGCCTCQALSLAAIHCCCYHVLATVQQHQLCSSSTARLPRLPRPQGALQPSCFCYSVCRGHTQQLLHDHCCCCGGGGCPKYTAAARTLLLHLRCCCCCCSAAAHEALHSLQPVQVLLLLLVEHEVAQVLAKVLVDAALRHVFTEGILQLAVKLAEHWASEDSI